MDYNIKIVKRNNCNVYATIEATADCEYDACKLARELNDTIQSSWELISLEVRGEV